MTEMEQRSHHYSVKRRWLARLGFGAGTREASPGPMPIERIRGGDKAPLLFMKPDDVDWANVPTGHMQLKLDGIGAGMIDNRIVTPEGAPMNCARHCLPGLLRLQEKMGQPMMVDGEYVEEAGYDATMSSFQRGEGTGIFWVYDAVPLEDWVNNRCSIEIEERLARLEDAKAAVDSPFIGLVLSREIDDPAKVVAWTKDIWAAGWEGTMVKKRRSLYVRQRSTAWSRLKEVVTHDCRLLDVGVNKAGVLTKVVVQGPDGPLALGSGWDKISAACILELFAAHRPPMIEAAWNRKAGSTRPRHARFIRIRYP